jgi:hypothetical protein
VCYWSLVAGGNVPHCTLFWSSAGGKARATKRAQTTQNRHVACFASSAHGNGAAGFGRPVVRKGEHSGSDREGGRRAVRAQRTQNEHTVCSFHVLCARRAGDNGGGRRATYVWGRQNVPSVQRRCGPLSLMVGRQMLVPPWSGAGAIG